MLASYSSVRSEGSPLELGLMKIATLVDFMGFPSSASVCFLVIETCCCSKFEREILIAK